MTTPRQHRVCCVPCRPLTKEPDDDPGHDDILTGILQAAVALRRLHAHPVLKRVLGAPTTVSKHCKRMPLVFEQEAADSEQAPAMYKFAMQKRGTLERQIREAAAETAAAASLIQVPAGQAHQAAVHELQEAPAAQSVTTADGAGAASILASGEANAATTYRLTAALHDNQFLQCHRQAMHPVMVLWGEQQCGGCHGCCAVVSCCDVVPGQEHTA